jgi:SPP1 family predicted phage head-tail adaptor
MRWRVELLDMERADDGAGGFTRSDTAEATRWAEIRTATAREVSAAERLEQIITHVIKLRWERTVRPRQGMRVRWQDRMGTVRTAYVETVQDEDEKGRFWLLQVREGGAL